MRRFNESPYGPAQVLAKAQGRAIIALFALGLIAAGTPQLCAAEDSAAQRAAWKAHVFLKTEQRGKDILGYVHFGTTYRGHEYLKTLRGDDGQFVLVYRYRWDEDGVSDVGFLCDGAGNVSSVRVLSTNAVINQPFLLANAAIKLLGNFLIGAFQDQMSPNEQKLVQRFVDAADAQGLLEWSLRFEQALGK